MQTKVKPTILHNKEDFIWHKRKCDADYKYKFSHYEEPKKFPCLVESKEEWAGENRSQGQIYNMNHSFYYVEGHECSECRHIHKNWPPKALEIIEQEKL